MNIVGNECLLINFPSENVFLFSFRSKIKARYSIQVEFTTPTDEQKGETMIYSIITLHSNINVSQFELNFFSCVLFHFPHRIRKQFSVFKHPHFLTVDPWKERRKGLIRKRCVIFTESSIDK